MNKKLLSLLVLPLVGMASCGGNNFKEVKYLSVNGATYVTEKGVVETISHVAKYKLDETSSATIANYLVDFPSTFNIYVTERIDPNADKTPYVMPKTIDFDAGLVSVKLNLEGNETRFRTYTEYFYNESSRQVKAVVHEDEPLLTGSSEMSAICDPEYGQPDVRVEFQEETPSFPTSKYSLKYVEHKFTNVTKERIYSIGSIAHIEAAYK